MTKTFISLLSLLSISFHAISQFEVLSPSNNIADIELLRTKDSHMIWYMVNDSTETKIGDVQTQIRKEEDFIYLITSIDLEQSAYRWIDSTVVRTPNLEPFYHSSYNQQRDLVLEFGNKITGYHFDKQTEQKTEIAEETSGSFFDSNFYPELISLLPLKHGFQRTIAIFDYKPKAVTGVLTATIKNTEKTTITHNGVLKEVWKVVTTDDISNNATIITYFFDRKTRKKLLQEVGFKNGKMIFKAVD